MNTEIRGEIERKSRDRVRIYLESRETWPFARSLTNLTEEAAHEYGDRFLVELIQNAYDAHPVYANDGVVRIVLDDTEGTCGVLYVANSGQPFTTKNFDALSNIAQSDKVPGEGIGNKGIGFRSVLQVCEDPEVFSTTSDWRKGQEADGFCFGFAKEDDLERLTSSKEELNAVRADLTRYLLPVPISAGGKTHVQQLLDAGCVTVVRLPLKGPRALASAREQLERLNSDEHPLLLFLDRLAAIETTQLRAEGRNESNRVQRASQKVSGLRLPKGASAEEVDVQGRHFLVFRQPIDAARVRQAVQQSIDAGDLGASWSKWEVDAEVAVALARDADGLTPALFTFLPMGSEARAPLHGFLNAPFYTKLARTSLDERVPLNSFLLDRGADLCVAAISALTESVRSDRFTAVCDLLTWNAPHLQRLKQAFERAGSELEKALVVPAVQRGTDATWCRLADAYVWDETNLEVMDAREVAKQADVPVVLPTVGRKRTARLEELHEACFGRGMKPTDETIATWAESIAKHLHGVPFDQQRWNSFYRDLTRIYRYRDASALRGRRILIDSREHLLPAGPWDQEESGDTTTAVFFAPRHKAERGPSDDEPVEDDEDIEIPARLRRAITYLHLEIALASQEGTRLTRTAVHEFLERARLVLPYRRRALIGHVSRLLARAKGDRTHQEALFWAFRQYVATNGEIRDLKDLPLRVPTSEGWVVATSAMFGRGWATTLGGELADLLAELKGRETYALELEQCLLLPPDKWLPEPARAPEWISFLRSIGVRDGLFPVALPHRRLELEGRSYSSARIAHEFALPAHVADQWQSAVGHRASAISHPYTPYRNRGELWVLPGQQSYPELDRRGRELFAALLLQSVGAWPDECLKFTFERFRSSDHRRYPDTQTWPSPAWAFVCRAAWVPMADPRRRSDTYYSELTLAWHHDDSGKETAPRFARLLPIEFRRRIQRNSNSLPRLTDAGLRTWNDRRTAGGRLAECADLIAGGHLTEGDASGVRRACREAWHDLTVAEDAARDVHFDSLPLVVSRGHTLAVVDVEASSESTTKIFVPGVTRGIVAQVIEALGESVLEVDADDGRAVRAFLSHREDVSILPIDEVEARYIADGTVVALDADRPFLITNQSSWLVEVLLVILDLQSSQFVRVTEHILRRAAERLRRVRVWWASNVDIEIDGEAVQMPGDGSQPFALDDPESPLIVAPSSSQSLNWDVVESLAAPLAEILGNRAAAREIALACVRLDRALNGAWREPTPTEVAEALGLPLERVSASLASFRHDLATAITRVAAVVAHFEDVERGRSVLTHPFEDDNSLLKGIADLPHLPVPAEELVRIARTAGDLGEIRRVLGIDFAEFNRTLRALGSPFSPITDAERHAQVFRYFLSTNRKWILNSLRERFLEDFSSGKPLDDYLALRRLDQFDVPEEWLERYEAPPEDLMMAFINCWLDSHGAAPIGSCTHHLEDLDELRRRNEAFVENILPKLANLLAAWCTQNGSEMPAGWLAEGEDPGTPRAYIRASGRLDFIAIAEEHLVAWLAEGCFWPLLMPATTNLEVLGLDPSVLDRGEREHRARKEEARRAALLVILDGEQLDASEANYAQLAAKTRASVDQEFLETSKRAATLADIAPKERGSGGEGGDGTRRARRERLTKEQRAAVGLVGEVLAYEWLRNRYSTEMTPDSWVSRYRGAILGGSEGDDSLGYDFEVVQKSQTLRFEVKATSTDACEFPLTESELRAAQGARRGTYRIIFIRNVLDKSRRTLHVLPNPFEDASRGKYRVINEGLRYCFELGIVEDH